MSFCHLVFDCLYFLIYFLLLKTDTRHHYFPYFHLVQTKITGYNSHLGSSHSLEGTYGPWESIPRAKHFTQRPSLALYFCRRFISRVCSRYFIYASSNFLIRKLRMIVVEDYSNSYCDY